MSAVILNQVVVQGSSVQHNTKKPDLHLRLHFPRIRHHVIGYRSTNVPKKKSATSSYSVEDPGHEQSSIKYIHINSVVIMSGNCTSWTKQKYFSLVFWRFPV